VQDPTIAGEVHCEEAAAGSRGLCWRVRGDVRDPELAAATPSVRDDEMSTSGSDL